MNRIIETIEREKIVKKYRRSRQNAVKGTFDPFEALRLSNSVREYWEKENIKSVELSESSDSLAIKYNDKPGTFHVPSNKKPELEEIGKWLKESNMKELVIELNHQHHDFSRVHLLAGEEHNQELVPLKGQINLIDFSQHNHENPKFIERKIKEIYNNPQNQELIKKGEFPVICFKNIEKIGQNQALEEALLPVFDQQQNAKLFNKEIDLSKFILIATTSTHETEKLSAPLLSRLDWVNADTAQPKKFFLDKYYYWLLVPSLLINFVLLGLLLLPKLKRAKRGKTRN